MMARHAARDAEGEVGSVGAHLPTGGKNSKDVPVARPLDPLILALARAVDRLEGTAG